jgi:hypothetical protein
MQRQKANHPRKGRTGTLLLGGFVLLVVVIVAWTGRRGGSALELGDLDLAPNSGRRVTSYGSASRGAATKSHGAAHKTAGPQVVLRATWGSGTGQLGRQQAAESSPEGPASFLVDEAGRAFVLDQVNLRIQVYEQGRFKRSIPLPADTFEDLALMADGSVAVLDRLSRRTVRIMDPRGQLVSEVNLEGPGVGQGGAVTGLFAQDDGLWVEVAHGRLVRIADATGKADPQRPWVAGRFAAGGSKVLSATLDGRYAAEIITRPAVASKVPAQRLARVDFDLRLAHLTALETDAAGNVYLGALMMRHRQSAPFDVLEQRSEVVVVSPRGRELRRISLPAPDTALEFLRSIRVSPDGTIWHLAFDAHGATLRRY